MMHTNRKKRDWALAFVLVFLFLILGSIPVHAAGPVVIAIDPGHGGENLGAEYDGYTEKEMTMAVAEAMKEELEKYEGVTVFLTHESSEDDMSLKERVELAKEKNADFLFCLHFNMSLGHNLYGSEVWVSAFDRFYARGYAFARIELDMLADMGLYSRGIKTRLNDAGEDYYGIIRESLNVGLDTVLIEHCHLDQEKDKPFYTHGHSQLEEFGRLDATAAAKYFRLRSQALGVDYSDYPVPKIAIPDSVVKPDLSPPDVCLVAMDSLEKGEAVFTLTAQDHDSRILYYAYSLDGGKSYTDLESFPQESNQVTFQTTLPKGQTILFCAAAYNAYDRITESNMIEIVIKPEEPAWEEQILGEVQGKEAFEEISLKRTKESEHSPADTGSQVQIYQLIMIIIVSLMILVMMIFVFRILLFRRTRGTS